MLMQLKQVVLKVVSRPNSIARDTLPVPNPKPNREL